jgi:hypothetical protein
MIDVGDNSVPAFFDSDNDGDLDLLLGYNINENGAGGIYFYENTGSSILPKFRYVTNNYIDLNSLSLTNVKIQIVDITRDGRPDLTLMATNSANKTSAYFIPNLDGFDKVNIKTIDVPLAAVDNIHFSDISGDGILDMLVGKSNGSLQYWMNTGDGDNPLFQLQNDAYLGLSPDATRQNIACFTGDLNTDGNNDFVFADHTGKLYIIDDFLKSSQGADAETEILFNELAGSYHTAYMGGTSWPTIANILGKERPQIISGNILGGLRILRNENKASDFSDLILSVYPNPVKRPETLKIFSNLSATLMMCDAVGKIKGRNRLLQIPLCHTTFLPWLPECTF